MFCFVVVMFLLFDFLCAFVRVLMSCCVVVVCVFVVFVLFAFCFVRRLFLFVFCSFCLFLYCGCCCSIVLFCRRCVVVVVLCFVRPFAFRRRRFVSVRLFCFRFVISYFYYFVCFACFCFVCVFLCVCSFVDFIAVVVSVCFRSFGFVCVRSYVCLR